LGDEGGEESNLDFLIVRPKEEVRGGDSGAGGKSDDFDRFLLLFTTGVIGSGEDEGVDEGDMVGEGVTLGEGGGESGMSMEEFTSTIIKFSYYMREERGKQKDTYGMSLAECPFLQVQFDESGKRAIGS
jgi:hypothetical protein